MKRLHVPKGQILQLADVAYEHAYQVESGLLRSYSVDAKGKEHIFMFAPKGWLIADSIPLGQANSLFIDALEDSEVQLLNKREMTQADLPKIIRRLSVLQERIIMLMSAPAIDRYAHFLEMYPDIVQRVPQKMIASYLGITPEALSKVKRNWMERNS